VIAALIAIVLAVVALPPLLVRDGPAPASLAPFVDSARAQLRSEAIDGPFFWLPLHLRFSEARCSVDQPGRVALVFDVWRPPYLGTPFAVAMRGSFPSGPADSWGGGFGTGSIFDDDEFIYQMGTNTIPCA